MPPRRVEIAPLALRELNEILEYTEETWGLEKALDYSSALFESFDHLCTFPDMGRDRSDVDEGLRCVVSREHFVFYRVYPEMIEITRIVHVGRESEAIERKDQ